MSTPSLTWGPVDDPTRPLAVLVHGFPDTPHTWRHLGPVLATEGWRVVAPWLRGYAGDLPTGPVSVGTYARDVVATYAEHGGDDRALLVGHDWGAGAAYGLVSEHPGLFAHLVTLAVPPARAIGDRLFSFAQARRSWYVWLAQQHGTAEAVMGRPGFWASLWADWSPGYDASEDLEPVVRALGEPGRLTAALAPYRASLQPEHQDAAAMAEHYGSLRNPEVPTLYLHGADDGCLAAELAATAGEHLPAPGSRAEILAGCGHFLHVERPEQVNRLITQWLAETG